MQFNMFNYLEVVFWRIVEKNNCYKLVIFQYGDAVKYNKRYATVYLSYYIITDFITFFTLNKCLEMTTRVILPTVVKALVLVCHSRRYF